MTKNEFLRIPLTRKEMVWGIRYLLFQTVFLSSFLGTLNWVLPVTLDRAQLNFLFFCINFGAVAVIFRRYLVQFLRLDLKAAVRIGAVSVALFGVYWVATTLLGYLLTAIEPGFANVNDQSIAAVSQENYWLMFFGTAVLVPITEECLYRGLIFRGLYDRSPALAWIISAAVFSAVHLLGYTGYELRTLFLCFLQYLPAGLCLAAAYRLSGSLIPPILIHAAVNTMGMIALR